jgi:hypothetical protein
MDALLKGHQSFKTADFKTEKGSTNLGLLPYFNTPWPYLKLPSRDTVSLI